MNRKDFIYTLTASLVLGLGSCTSEDFWDTFDRTVDGPIEFTVGVEASPAQRALTRAEESPATTGYYAMQPNTRVRLRVDGAWNRKPTSAISKQTTCTAETATGTINALSFTESEKLYWDDYGFGDPDNSENYSKGLQVLGVAVDGMDEAPEINDKSKWESLPWAVATDGKNVLNSDIIVSNNLYVNRYKFEKPTKEHPGNLVFTHPLSKITINIKAGVGFTKGSIGKTTYKFEEDPVVTLTHAKSLDGITNSANDYCLTNGTINIATATATAASEGKYKAAVIAGTTSTTDKTYTVIKQAIVYPDTQFGDNDDDVIAVVQADGNVYYVTAKQIRAKITEVGGHTDFKTKAGYNYIINVTVNKTGLLTTATVTAWNEVVSDEAYPKINVTGSETQTVSLPSSVCGKFNFWYSETIDGGYVCGATPSIISDGTMDWKETNLLYWPDHNTHYHFRGLFPYRDEDAKTGPLVVEDKGIQVVKVANGAYNASTSPSNFMIGMPEFDDETLCGNKETGHTQVDMRTGGICAREGYINLNFRYMMSQVEVNLTSNSTDASSKVVLDNATVELVNVGTEGNILLSNRSAEITNEGTFTLPHTSGYNYHGVIIPQTLIDNAATDKNKVKFKITLYTDATKTTKTNVYYADVAPIKVKEKNSSADAAATDAWQSGVHYVYNLNITKTQINATATLTDWKTYEASEEVWF